MVNSYKFEHSDILIRHSAFIHYMIYAFQIRD